eukprot:CAMPEP_0170451740 /NCGR_PEP_ID=MMETSP0123-20130129/880_1 /TAXON_ID=182087 /ORGANISM="Favella ehrenbergii, Strain Fehren 1" /LENGTH=84 /DNA_ID=CAMNT_0010713531 /DNA_START=343 /DNA_END=598 /DNA_ORIENTATION=-
MRPVVSGADEHDDVNSEQVEEPRACYAPPHRRVQPRRQEALLPQHQEQHVHETVRRRKDHVHVCSDFEACAEGVPHDKAPDERH